jgi:hypothetical protein
MKTITCLISLVTMLSSVLLAQHPFAISSSVKRGQGSNASLPFCPPKSCLYYAGDFDSNNPSANGLYNADSAGTGEGQVWVGVKPAHDAIVTGATFNECMSPNNGVGVNPTPFVIQTGIGPGHAGTIICNTNGNATLKYYQSGDVCNQESYSIAMLAKSCRLKKGRVYYVNLLPTYEDSTFGALTDVEDKPAPNHYGWKTIIDNSYFNSTSFGDVYVPTWGSSGACSGVGCDAFSIALTGKQKK